MSSDGIGGVCRSLKLYASDHGSQKFVQKVD
jgi:hypothetical protein